MESGLTMKRFNFKRRKLFAGPHLLGSLLIVAGLVALAGPLVMEEQASLEKAYGVGVGALLLGLIIVTTYKGTLIDFTKKKWKSYVAICGVKFGEWAILPAIWSVKVSPSSYRQTNTPNGISPTLTGSVTEFVLALWGKEATPLFSFVYTNRNRAVKQAKRLAFNLGAELEIPERT